MGVLVTVKVKASDTSGAYSVFEDFIPPGAGPVPHTHTKEDETIYVLEGKLSAWLGGQEHHLRPGDFVHMPRGMEHYFKNVTDEPTRLLLTYSPGGFEQWFLDVGTPVNDKEMTPPEITSQDVEKAISEAQQYGVRFTKRR
jgi:quercetin dioxygenase-like cupin family protein